MTPYLCDELLRVSLYLYIQKESDLITVEAELNLERELASRPDTPWFQLHVCYFNNLSFVFMKEKHILPCRFFLVGQ